MKGRRGRDERENGRRWEGRRGRGGGKGGRVNVLVWG